MGKGRRPPSFYMHVYHHFYVVFMAWLWLDHVQSLQFGGLMFNTIVHVVMYYYYYLLARGVKKIWWKNYVTKLQIVQFVTSLGCFAVFLYFKLVEGRACKGEYAL